MTIITRFNHAAFPLKNQTKKKSFFDIHDNNRLGHTSARGGVYWEKETYNDNRVLIAIPNHLQPRKKMTLILFLHGNQTLLERDLITRQKVAQQLFDSGANAILIAPQLAQDALDSSAGNFALENFAQYFLIEIAKKIDWVTSKRISEAAIATSRVVLMAYSGGYLPAAKILEVGNIDKRIKGIALLDALYGEEEIFADFMIRHSKNAFLFSCFTEPAIQGNEKLSVFLREKGLSVGSSLPTKFNQRNITLLKLGNGISHRDLLTRTWRKNILMDFFNRL